MACSIGCKYFQRLVEGDSGEVEKLGLNNLFGSDFRLKRLGENSKQDIPLKYICTEPEWKKSSGRLVKLSYLFVRFSYWEKMNIKPDISPQKIQLYHKALSNVHFKIYLIYLENTLVTVNQIFSKLFIFHQIIIWSRGVNCSYPRLKYFEFETFFSKPKVTTKICFVFFLFFSNKLHLFVPSWTPTCFNFVLKNQQVLTCRFSDSTLFMAAAKSEVKCSLGALWEISGPRHTDIGNYCKSTHVCLFWRMWRPTSKSAG